jgi:hypothetical protein
MSKYVRASDWKPWAAKLHVANVERLVTNLGGENLYGQHSDYLEIALRELIQNGRDAIVARRSLDPGFEGKLIIRFKEDADSCCFLSVEDDGTGMSERVLTGPLLDFGTSFWATSLVQEEFPGLRSSKFKPVGKFGIGFYSIFMIANEVRVASRRWDRGLDTICQLHFPHGLSLRPIVSFGDRQGFGGYTSTLVSCRLNSGIMNRDRVVEVNSGMFGVADFKVKIADYLAALTAGLDIGVELECDGEKVIVHESISTVVRDRKYNDWLSRISFFAYQPGVVGPINAYASRLRPLLSGERIVGLATLRTDSGGHFMNVRTVGGLAASVHARHSSNFIGYMDHEPGSAKREGTRIAASTDDLKVWSDEQIRILEMADLPPLAWCIITCDLAGLEIDPSPVLKAAFRRQDQFNILGLEEIFKELDRDAIAILKMRHLDHVEVNSAAGPLENYLTFQPVVNSGFLSLKLDGDIPVDKLSFIGCLYRYAASKGRRLLWQTRPGVGISFFGPIDALLISLSPEVSC